MAAMSRREKKAIAQERAKRFLSRVKSVSKCKDCGTQPVQFHHRDGDGRENTRIARLACQGQTIARIKAEIRKCDPLCSACHSKRHHPAIPCSICGERAYANGLCRFHYMAARGAHMAYRPPCAVCGDRSYAHSLCYLHYRQEWRRRRAEAVPQ